MAVPFAQNSFSICCDLQIPLFKLNLSLHQWTQVELWKSPIANWHLQGLFSTKQVHKQESVVSINRQHELYAAPLTSWLSPIHQAGDSQTLHWYC